MILYFNWLLRILVKIAKKDTNMLVDKSIKTLKSGDIVSIMLSTGQEIVAKLVEQDSTNITVTGPLVLHVMSDAQGRPVAQMIPMMMSADASGKIELQRSHVIMMVLSADSARQGYMKNTTGLEIPTSSVISSLKI